MPNAITKPCEFCGTLVSKTKTQSAQRKYWTCNASCANKLRIQLGNTHWAENPMRGQKETRPCTRCGKPVERYLSPANKDIQWFCSKSCRSTHYGLQKQESGEWKRPNKPRRGEEKPCATCGTPVYFTQGQLKSGSRFCSVDCSNVWKASGSTTVECEWCKKPFSMKPSWEKDGRKFCSQECYGEARIKRPLERVYNGRRAKQDDQGYVMVWEPSHPNKTLKGWQYEHRLIAETSIGRYLQSDEHVHHVNGVKDDNRPENLQVLSQNEHAAISSREQVQKVKDMADKLAEYERRYGPLKE